MTLRKTYSPKQLATKQFKWDTLKYVDTIVMTKVIDETCTKEESVCEFVRMNIPGSDFGLHTSISSSDKIVFCKWLFKRLCMRPLVKAALVEVQTQQKFTRGMAKELYAINPIKPADHVQLLVNSANTLLMNVDP